MVSPASGASDSHTRSHAESTENKARTHQRRFNRIPGEAYDSDEEDMEGIVRVAFLSITPKLPLSIPRINAPRVERVVTPVAMAQSAVSPNVTPEYLDHIAPINQLDNISDRKHKHGKKGKHGKRSEFGKKTKEDVLHYWYCVCCNPVIV